MTNLNPLNEFINKWKELSNNYYKELFEVRKEMSQSEFINKYGKGDFQLVTGYNLKMISEIIDKDAIKRTADFIKRIEKKVGDIVEANLRMGTDLSINGTVVGTKDNATVHSIIAGGYNIQKAHYRVLVK